MAAGRLIISDLRGGRNGADPPEFLRENECAEALNVDTYKSPLGNKRNGASANAMAFSAGGPFTGVASSLIRHVPASDETAAELWAVDDAATPMVGRIAAATTFTAPTLKDALTGNGWDVSSATLNGLLFLAYKSAQDRLHVWDGSTVRRSGFATPAAPTAANTGAGTYAATLRYYRVRWTTQASSVTTRRSEPGASLSFTPSGAGTGVVVTQPAVANEGETHWEVEVSLDNATFYLLSTVVIGTTTYTDSAATTTYASGTVSATTGTYTAQKSYRFIAADQNRLLGFSSYTTTDKQNRIEISAVVGSLNVGDAERAPSGSYIDLDEADSGAAMGLIGPVNSAFYAFKYRQFWKLIPNGNPLTVYDQKCISKAVGAVGPKAIVVAEDEGGSPCVYFMSPRGPYRYGRNGLEYIGRGVEDLLLPDAPNSISVMNLAATKVVCHAVYHTDKRQVWFWVATSSNNDPDTKLVFQIGRAPMGMAVSDHPVPSGWFRHTGRSANARCSVMFAKNIAATMSRDLKPFAGYAGAASTMYRCDDATLSQDDSTNYQAYVTSKAYAPWGFGVNGEITPGEIVGVAQGGGINPGPTITQSIIGDFGVQTTTSTVALTQAGTESRVQVQFEGAAMSGRGFVQFQWGDSAAANNTWALDAVQIPWIGGEPR